MTWSGGGGRVSGDVACRLDDCASWPVTGPNRYYSLYTYGTVHAVNLLENGDVSVWLNRGLMLNDWPANLHGRLTVFLGHWQDESSYVFYFCKNAFPLPPPPLWFPPTEPWFQTRLRVTPDLSGWEIVGSPPSTAGTGEALPGHLKFPLAMVLRNPQQWGLAIVGVETGKHPGQWLGFDDLVISPCKPQLTIERDGPRHVRLGGWNADEPFTIWACDALPNVDPLRAIPLVTLRSGEALIQEVVGNGRFYYAQ